MKPTFSECARASEGHKTAPFLAVLQLFKLVVEVRPRATFQ